MQHHYVISDRLVRRTNVGNLISVRTQGLQRAADDFGFVEQRGGALHKFIAAPTTRTRESLEQAPESQQDNVHITAVKRSTIPDHDPIQVIPVL